MALSGLADGLTKGKEKHIEIRVYKDGTRFAFFIAQRPNRMATVQTWRDPSISPSGTNDDAISYNRL